MSTMIRCLHQKNGCRWVDKLQNLEIHLESCHYNLVPCPKDCGAQLSRQCLQDHLEFTCSQRRLLCDSCGLEFTGAAMETHQGNCPQEVVWCENKCGARLQRRYLNNHSRNECHKRTVVCQYCKKEFVFETLQNHAQSCLRYPINCPNRCEVGKVAREDMEVHLRESCNTVQVSCLFKYAGCKYTCPRPALDRHLQENQSQHLALLGDMVARQQLEINTLTTRLEHLGRVNDGVLVWKIDKVSEMLDTPSPRQPVELKSDPFYSSRYGYKLGASVFVNGNGSGEGNHLSLYIRMLPGEFDNILTWPFMQNITFRLLDQCGNPEKRQDVVESFVPSPSWKQFQKPGKDCETMGFGYPKFLSHDFLRHGTFIKDDAIFIKITVEDSKYILPPSPSVL